MNVVKLLSRVIMDLAEGEIKQNLNRFDSAQSFSKYINKSYCKTASLIANSCKAAGVLRILKTKNCPRCTILQKYRFSFPGRR